MKYNVNTRFSQNPASLDMSRSVFDRINNHKTTFNTGKLIPVYTAEVLPGDTVTMDTSFLVRMTTPVFPVMDNAFIDLFWFFVPNRLVWDKWKEFNGENDVNAWANTEDYIVPAITSDPSDADSIPRGSLADYFGLPTAVPIRSDTRINALPFRGYQLIWNEYFRDQNLQNPLLIDKGSSDVYWYEITSGLNRVLPVNKIHDYFTSCLPAPQKGSPVLLGFEDPVPVFTGLRPTSYVRNENPLYWQRTGTDLPEFNNTTSGMVGVSAQGATRVDSNTDTPGNSGVFSAAPANLFADTTALTISINQLRQAFQVQKLLERDARGGTRYWELIKAHFGVTAPDASLQRPEFLGSSRTYINMTQVVQNSSSDTTSPQGNTAAFSKTVNSENSFTKSFTEHGFLFGLACVRTDHTYQQGINKQWLRQTRFDYYWPALANIGEQPVMLDEIYYDSDNVDAGERIFGYQEAWASYRYSPSYVSGAFRSNVNGSLDSWHYADYYQTVPVLSNEWIQETAANVDRTLAVQSSLEDQFLGDFYFKSKWTRPMPVYSVPGLVDHH